MARTGEETRRTGGVGECVDRDERCSWKPMKVTARRVPLFATMAALLVVNLALPDIVSALPHINSSGGQQGTSKQAKRSRPPWYPFSQKRRVSAPFSPVSTVPASSSPFHAQRPGPLSQFGSTGYGAVGRAAGEGEGRHSASNTTSPSSRPYVDLIVWLDNAGEEVDDSKPWLKTWYNVYPTSHGLRALLYAHGGLKKVLLDDALTKYELQKRIRDLGKLRNVYGVASHRILLVHLTEFIMHYFSKAQLELYLNCVKPTTDPLCQRKGFVKLSDLQNIGRLPVPSENVSNFTLTDSEMLHPWTDEKDASNSGIFLNYCRTFKMWVPNGTTVSGTGKNGIEVNCQGDDCYFTQSEFDKLQKGKFKGHWSGVTNKGHPQTNPSDTPEEAERDSNVLQIRLPDGLLSGASQSPKLMTECFNEMTGWTKKRIDPVGRVWLHKSERYNFGVLHAPQPTVSHA